MSETGIVVTNEDELPEETSGHVPMAPEPMSRARMLEANRAARAAGMVSLRASKLKGAADMGDYISECGAIKIGRSYIVANMEAINKALGQMNREAELPHDPETMTAINKSRNEAFGNLTRAAEVLIKSAETEKFAGPTPLNKPAWEPGQPMQPPIQIQINNQMPGPPAPAPGDVTGSAPLEA